MPQCSEGVCNRLQECRFLKILSNCLSGLLLKTGLEDWKHKRTLQQNITNADLKIPCFLRLLRFRYISGLIAMYSLIHCNSRLN